MEKEPLKEAKEVKVKNIRKVKKKEDLNIHDLKPVIVLWKDIVGIDKSWIPKEEIMEEHTHSCQRICYLVKITEDEIYFVAGSSADGCYEEVNVMPKGAVKEIIPINMTTIQKKKIFNFIKDGTISEPVKVKGVTKIEIENPKEEK